MGYQIVLHTFRMNVNCIKIFCTKVFVVFLGDLQILPHTSGLTCKNKANELVNNM